MGIPASLGIGSGLNLSGLLDSLAQTEQKRLIPLKTQKASYNAELSAYGRIQNALDKLQSAAESLDKGSLYSGVKVSSNSEAFTATGSENAVPGHYQVEVTQLARAQSLATGDIAEKDTAIGSGGTITLTLGQGSDKKSVDITLGAQESSLTGVRDAINAADIGINASIIDDGAGDRFHLILSSQETGTANTMTVSVANNADLANILHYDGSGASALNETLAAQNAQLNINGIAISSQSNTVKNAIQGVTLTLTGETSNGAATLDTTRDLDAIKNTIESFVSAYNNYHKVKEDLTAFNGQEKASGILIGESSIRRIENSLRQTLNAPIQGSDYYNLAQIGVSTTLDGTLEIDSDKLDKALRTNLDDVKALLSGGKQNEGLAGIMTGTLKELAGDNGMLSTVTEGIENSIDRLNERMGDMQESIDAQINRYRQQFQQLDKVMAQLNSTQSYLSTQLAAFGNDNNK